MSLGNDKPEVLSQVERLLWQSLLRIASGATIPREIQRFLAASEASLAGQGNVGADWFHSGKLIFHTHFID
jgi:hypothetical protein